MGIVSDSLSRMEVRVTSADGNIQARLAKRGKVDIGIRDGHYGKYSDSGLATQLSDVLTKLGSGYRGAMDKILEADLGRPVERGENWDARQRRYLAERREIEARGVSPKQCFRTKLHNLSSWTAEVKPGTIASLKEAEFIAEVRSAVNATLNDFSKEEYRLKREYGKTFHSQQLIS